MVLSFEWLQELLKSSQQENEHLEFKEAKVDFSLDKLLKYCVALANEGGGKLVLGVSDKIPRKVVGTQSFKDLNQIKLQLIQKLNLRLDIQEYDHPDGRVLVFCVPSRHLGVPLHHEGTYLMRGGESLIPMTQDTLKRIFSEVESDFSAQICRFATINDLDLKAIDCLRDRLILKSNNQIYVNISNEQLLMDLDLIDNMGITNAALILLGTSRALHKFLPQAEVIFEYRSNEVAGAAQQRIEYQHGFFLSFDDLWKTINLRNDLQHFQNGFFVLDVPTFSEKVIREAVLNAVAHRDYQSNGSVFVRQYPRKIQLQSPGGFPRGVDARNVLWNQNPRNRRIADVFVKCGLVERAGQGVNLMFEESIKQGKSIPDYSHTDSNQVCLTLSGEVRDPNFLRFLSKIGQEKLASFSTEDFLVLDFIHRKEIIPLQFQSGVKKLLEAGVIEKTSQGSEIIYLFSKRYFDFIQKREVKIGNRNSDRDVNKGLILQCIKKNFQSGSSLQELMGVLPDLSKAQFQKLLQEMKHQGVIRVEGATRGSLWYPCLIAPK